MICIIDSLYWYYATYIRQLPRLDGLNCEMFLSVS